MPSEIKEPYDRRKLRLTGILFLVVPFLLLVIVGSVAWIVFHQPKPATVNLISATPDDARPANVVIEYQEPTYEPLTLPSTEETEAAEIHLRKCGLRDAGEFGETEAWYRETGITYNVPTRADAVKEMAAIQAMAIWAENQRDPKVRAAYLAALKPHQEGVDEFLKELEDHHEQKHMAEFDAGQKERDARARAIQSSMPSPCHTPGKVK